MEFVKISILSKSAFNYENIFKSFSQKNIVGDFYS